MKQTLIAFDQMVNTVVWASEEGFGMADETISARAWRLRARPAWGTLRKVVDKIFFWEENHCEESYLFEKQRKQLPVEYYPGSPP